MIVGVIVVNAALLVAARALALLVRPYGDPDSDVFRVVAGATGVRFSPRRLREGRVVCLLGAVELDLSDVEATDDARLGIVSVLGAVEVTVPSGWRVALRGGGVAGEVADRTEPGEGPTLRVDAASYLGAVVVRSTRSGAE